MMTLNMLLIMPMMLNHKYMDQILLLLLTGILTIQISALSNAIFALFQKAGDTMILEASHIIFHMKRLFEEQKKQLKEALQKSVYKVEYIQNILVKPILR